MDMMRLDQLPPPLGAKKGRYGYVRGRPAPVWIEDRFDWWNFAERVKTIIAIAGGIVAIAIAVKSLL